MVFNPGTSKIRDALTHKEIRLSHDDRQFLHDLAKVEFISSDIAQKHHYQNRKTDPTVRLNRLVESGLLKRHFVTEQGRGQLSVYEFGGDNIAKAWGAKRSHFGANRTLHHELVTSRLYFKLESPSDFRKENKFTKNDKKFIQERVGGRHDYQPDAMYTGSHGETVFVEADSGQYNRTQIHTKQQAWRRVKQVWGQPGHAFAPICSQKNIEVYKV